MTAAHKKLMLRYIKHCSGRIEVDNDCDVCWVERPDAELTLESYLSGDKDGLTSLTPTLCFDHGRELGVVW